MIDFFKFFIILSFILLLNYIFLRMMAKKVYFIIIFISLILFYNFTFNNYFINIANIDVGISRASYLGINPTGVKSMLILTSIIIFISIYLLSKFISKNDLSKIEISINRRSNKFFAKELILISILTFFSTLFLLPQRLNQINNWKADLLAWDLQNFETWGGLLLKGYIPMRDFWYPYGNLIYLHAYPLKGLILTAVINFSVFLYVHRLSIIYNSSKYIRLFFYTVFFMLIVIYHSQNNFLVIPRYVVIPLGIALLSTLILNNIQIRFIDFLLLILPMLFALYYSILMIVLILLITLIKIIINYKMFNRNIYKTFIKLNYYYIFIPFFVTAIQIIISLKNNSLTNEIDLLFSRKYEQGLSYPMNMLDKFNEDKITYFFTIIVFIIITFIALLKIITNYDRKDSFINFQIVLLSVLIYFYLSLQKYSIRGPTDDSWMIAIVLSTIFILAQFNLTLQKKYLDFISLIILTVTLIWTIIYFRNNYNIKHEINFQLAEKFIQDKNLMDFKYRDINNYSIKNSWIQTLNFLEKNNSKKFFTLTDNGYLYLATGKSPYFHIAAHNMSNIIDDQKLLNLLKSDVPSFVVIDLHTFNFEGLNSQFRVPKTTQWIVDNYSNVTNFDDIYVFGLKKQKNDGIDKTISSLFKVNSLGHIPELISPENKFDCKTKDFNCYTILKAYLNLNSGFEDCNIVFKFNDFDSTFFFDISNRYQRNFIYIPISNMWFYPNKANSIEYSGCISKLEPQYMNTKSFY